MFGWKRKNRINKKKLIMLASFVFSLSAFLLISIFVLYYSRGPDKWVIISKIPPVLRDVGRESLKSFKRIPYIKYEFVKHKLPTYDLRVEKDTLNFLKTNLPKATEQMTDKYKVYVPAKFVDESGEEYEVRIRNRGVSRNHWLWDKKSIRVNFDSQDLYSGIKNLNFIVPSDRLYLVEEFNHYRAKRLGLVVPRSYFSVVTVNGKDPAVYWTVEHYDKEFLETAQLSSDANFYGESDEYTNNTSYKSLYDSIFSWKKYNNDVRFNEDNFAEINLLEYLVNDATDEEFRENIFSIVDKDNFYSWSVHNQLAFGQHQDWGHNVRAYFDSSVGKFKFIPVDVVMGDITIDAGSPDFFEEHSNILMNKVLSVPEFMQERNRRLWDYISNDYNLREELAYYDKLYDDTRIAFYQDKIRRNTNQFFDSIVSEYRNKIIKNVEVLRGFFEEVEYDFDLNIERDNVKLILSTKTLSPLQIFSLEIEGLDSDFSVLNSEGRFVCSRDTNIVDCNGDIITPSIEHVQLPSPEAIYPKIKNYYKAFRLHNVISEYNFVADDNVKWEDVKIKLFIKNIYTNEIISINL